MQEQYLADHPINNYPRPDLTYWQPHRFPCGIPVTDHDYKLPPQFFPQDPEDLKSSVKVSALKREFRELFDEAKGRGLSDLHMQAQNALWEI